MSTDDDGESVMRADLGEGTQVPVTRWIITQHSDIPVLAPEQRGEPTKPWTLQRLSDAKRVGPRRTM